MAFCCSISIERSIASKGEVLTALPLAEAWVRVCPISSSKILLSPFLRALLYWLQLPISDSKASLNDGTVLPILDPL